MKKLLPLFWVGAVFLFSGLTSCGSNPNEDRQNIVKTNLESSLLKKLHAPDSYQFGALELVDSVLYKDNVTYHKNFYSLNLNGAKEGLERQQKYKEEKSSMYVEEKVNSLNAEVKKYETILTEIDKLTEQLGEKTNDVASYTYRFTFKSENTQGVLSEYKYLVQTKPGPDYKIIELVQNESQALLHPNDFPGFTEMIKNYN
ncbi:hypothetical protein POV27_00390 [Aureisphaera galaxeae]|uniref:hypothetical protein n=1 Tax=Aureisphaera galaxeae TaxID=1538023 RepID=UPI00234FEAF7|nr:hypothetical protein [Aureisphaera galaxeae]MDC8002494.1 hypothetical protein [Aureisphaera galaxeae]